MKRAIFRIFVFAVIAFLIGVSLAFAQRLSGELRLQIVDPTGAGVRSSVTIIGQATGVDRTVETDEMGRFTIRTLPLGRYQLSVASNGFVTKTQAIEIASEIPFEHMVSLELSPVKTTVDVQDVDTLFDPVRTGSYLPPADLDHEMASAPNRAVIDLVNRQPGWLLEANGTLHPRGSEYDVQYVLDGVPLYDNRSPAFAQSTNIEEFQSLSVRTAGYPPEFGLKLGGVIEAASNQDAHPGLHGTASFQMGSFDSRAGFLSLGYGRSGTSITMSGDAMDTSRYLDPPVQQNYTNRGSGGGLSTIFDREWSAADHTRVYASHRNANFTVPNELLQELSGQRQDRDGGETFGQISHTHIFSPHLLGQFRVMGRDTLAALWSNSLSTPIQPSQNRGFQEGYLAGTISAHYGSHEIKAGAEGWLSSIREDLAFHITNYRLGSVQIFDRDVPRNFNFSQRAHGQTQSLFVQDSWHAASFSVTGGVRFDHYRLIGRDHAWSPRATATYEVPHGGLVFRASYDRAFQIPAIENILLASSDLSSALGGGAFVPLLASRGNFLEAGFSKSLSPRVRIDGTWYRRSFDNFADDSLLLNTGVSFPISFSSAVVRGVESKIEVRSLGPFTGQVSYSNMIGIGLLPVAGGLFLGDDARTLLQQAGSFPISQDQRNTFRSQLRFQSGSRWWLAFASSYNSGLPFEIDGPANGDFLAAQYGSRILDQINFDRGRIRPSSSVDVSGGLDIMHSDKMKLHFQVDVLNVANRLNVINFAGIFSGTALDAPRSFTLRLRSEF